MRDEWQNGLNVDASWRPQFNRCPVCSMDFDIIGDFEELGEDLAYFILKNNLGSSNVDRYLHEGKKGHYIGQGSTLYVKT